MVSGSGRRAAPTLAAVVRPRVLSTAAEAIGRGLEYGLESTFDSVFDSEIPGGVVTVPFAGQVTTDPSAYSVINLFKSDGNGYWALFQVSLLGPDSVFFQDRYMSKAEFARLSACPSK